MRSPILLSCLSCVILFLLPDETISFVPMSTLQRNPFTTVAKSGTSALWMSTVEKNKKKTTATPKSTSLAKTTPKASSSPPSSSSSSSSTKSRTTPPKKRNSSSSSFSNNAKNRNTKRDIVDAEIENKDSRRLLKARRILESFANNTADAGMMDSVRAPPVSGLSSPVDESSEIATPVPDSFWSNGHLVQDENTKQPGGYVTRWQKGVKVAEPLVRYDPIKAEKLLFRQPTKWMVRNVQIALPIGTWAAGVVFDYLMGNSKIMRRSRAKQLLKAVSGLGPAIIKGGQALASRPDLLPSEYLEELQKLQDDVPRFSNDLAFKIVEEELGEKFEDVFELIETEPIAAASIGQVYKARLLSNGDTVAIKIQRPKCEEIIALDLYVLRWWSGVYNQIFALLNRDIDIQSIIDDFGELIYREIDYVAEAANAQRFSELYAGVADVFVPKIYSDLTTSKVLTMEWVDGCRLTDSKSLANFGLDRKKLVDTLVQCSLRQILENGFFHADPHAGNLLACEDGRLCYLDFGMMSYAAVNQRNGFLLAVVHIVNRDWNELVRLYQKLGFIPEGTDLEPIEVALEGALPDVLSADISELNFKLVVNKLGDIMYTYPFSLPPFYIAIIRCLGVLEGLAIQVDPTSRIISEAYPYVASRVLTDTQNELKEALRRLALTPEGHLRWDRLEGLLEKAKDSQGYDVSAAVDQLTDYIISDKGEQLLSELADQVVDTADNLGAETIGYVIEASRALVVNDEVAAVKAFRSLQNIIQLQAEEGAEGIGKEVQKELQESLPPLTPSMEKFFRILTLLGAQDGQTDPAKFVPILRKLGQEPRVQRTASEMVARLGERMLSRGLRAAFGLPPPSFDGKSTGTETVTETS